MCYKDYGPAYGYWLFGFECNNHILDKYHTNKLSVEIQLMRRFVNKMNHCTKFRQGLKIYSCLDATETILLEP